MCEVDWRALGTWAAVVVALGIAVAGGVRTRHRERVQATLLATSLHVEVQQCVARASALVTQLDDDETGMMGALLFRLGGFPEDIARACNGFPTARLDAAALGIHVLPLACSRPLVDMRSCIDAIGIFGDTVHGLDQTHGLQGVEEAVESARAVAAKLRASAELAAEQVENVANRTPRWWQAIIG